MDSDDSLSDYGPGTSADGDTTLDTDDSDRTEKKSTRMKMRWKTSLLIFPIRNRELHTLEKKLNLQPRTTMLTSMFDQTLGPNGRGLNFFLRKKGLPRCGNMEDFGKTSEGSLKQTKQFAPTVDWSSHTKVRHPILINT